MNLQRRRQLFQRKRPSSLYRMYLWGLMIVGLLWLINKVETGAIQPLFLSTPTPTRTAQSFALEGDAQFDAGKLEEAITVYKEAARVDPSDARLWSKLARIQTYSSSLLTTDAQRQERLQEALDSINQAVSLAPDDSAVHAIRAFTLDWNATTALTTEDDRQSLLLEAEQEAVRALQLDNQNVLAQAFYAEVLVDQQKWTQAEQVIIQAVERAPNIMDVHRVYAYVLESLSNYRQAIEEYKQALEISPNLTFLYISIGLNYRRLGFGATERQERAQMYDQALEYFAMAANLNAQLGIKDPIPYIAIAKTYSQQGEFFSASLNILKALEFDPTNPDLYGQLGIIYFQARNYESSIPALRCALNGCNPETSCQARFIRSCQEGEGVTIPAGLPLSPNSLAYYLTYGSVLSALSRPEQNYCPEAMDIFSEIRAGGYASDPITANNVSTGEEICRSLEQSLLEPPTPFATPTLIPTPKP